MKDLGQLSRCEREVMDIIFRRKKASARDVWADLGEVRSYSTIRKTLSILEEKGYVTYEKQGAANIYQACLSREKAASSMIDRLIDTFFQGSVEQAVSGLLGHNGKSLNEEELERIEQLIAEAKKEAVK